ncbi:MAG: acetyl-CoA carboxylase biotin carboxyl carrier protein [Flavobacteriales bacterium]|nr:acetyl-CoA carboxylase biotin carboxyl carrier protein [Flavobacteriales bacterium]
MDLKEIQALIKFISTSGVDEVSIERKDFKLNIKKNQRTTEMVLSQPQVTYTAPAPVQTASPVSQAPLSVEEKPAAESVSGKGNLIEIKSPMIGTFYRSSGPDKDPFVSVGDSVNTGDTVCIIEAMKLFNEIESEIKGKIVKVLVDDATPVEYDQPLFLVDPS